ncbi:MAG: XrtA system polysaccharide chain length determinant [Wenzhouxiangella sp.]
MNELLPSHTEKPLTELVPASLREGRRHLMALTIMFVVVALVALGMAYTWPKTYQASTTILVTEDNIIRQLMEGRAVATSVEDRAAIAREVVFSRRVMDEVMRIGGWMEDNPTRADRDRRASHLEGRTKIDSPQDNLIVITYWDSQPERAQRVTEAFANLFIAESKEAKRRESREAYEFIAEQVEEYHIKLVSAERDLKTFRDSSEDARPGSGVEVSIRVAELRRDIENWRLERMDMQSRMVALAAQMNELEAVADVDSYQALLRQRIARAQDELDTLILDLTPRHPDVVRLRYQISDLKAELAEASQRMARDGERLFEQSPLQLELESAMAAVRREMAGMDARIEAAEEMLQAEIERRRRVSGSELQLAELTRDHDVNQRIYEDLVDRLENARLSMRMDEVGQGPAFDIHEPATVPAHAEGLRFIHVAAGGLVAAAALPLGMLLLLVRLDPRIRSPQAVERATNLPVVATVPTYWTPRERKRLWTRIRLTVALVVLTLIAYGVAGWLRLVVGG